MGAVAPPWAAIYSSKLATSVWAGGGNHLQARIFLSRFTVHPAAGGLAAVFTKAITRDEIIHMPKGERIAALLRLK